MAAEEQRKISDLQRIGGNIGGSAKDIGGVEEYFEKIPKKEGVYFQWEMEVEGAVFALFFRGLLTLKDLSEFRMYQEGQPKEVEKGVRYYESWCYAIVQYSLNHNHFTQEELDKELGKDLDEETADLKRLPVGTKVLVKGENTRTRWRRPHLRTPGYIFGAKGEIAGSSGDWTLPELFAHGGKDITVPVYRVKFRQKDIWALYHGEEKDDIMVEVSHPWLTVLKEGEEPSEENSFYPQNPPNIDEKKDPAKKKEHEDHVHEDRGIVEQNAVNLEGEETPFKILGQAYVRLLIAKGVVTKEDIRNAIDFMDSLSTCMNGKRIVARAWNKPSFLEALVQDANKAITEEFDESLALNGTDLSVLANTPEVHNVVVCTLCSCYPMTLLGRSPAWYRNRSYRSRVVKEPRKVLAEFGTEIPSEKRVCVLDSTSEMRYMIIPERPADTEGMTEEELQTLVHS